jgi:hypothetical protein
MTENTSSITTNKTTKQPTATYISVVPVPLTTNTTTNTIIGQLGDAGGYINGNLTLINKTQWGWTNVRLFLNYRPNPTNPYEPDLTNAYEYDLAQINPQQKISIPANLFKNNGISYNADETPVTLLILCDLPNNMHGEFAGGWVAPPTFNN